MRNKNKKNNEDGFFNTPRAYNLQAKGARVTGRGAGQGNGLRMHEINLLIDRASIIPVGLPRRVVWMGQVRRGSLKALLPDLGAITITQGEWFILRGEDINILADWENDAEVLAFSFCACVMTRLLSLAEEDIRPQLGLFASDEQLLPAVVQGTADARMRALEPTLRIEDCKTKDDALHLANRARNWIRELFRQKELAATNAAAFSRARPMNGAEKEQPR